MKKILIPIIIVVVLGTGVWWFIADNKTNESTDKSTFSVIDDKKENSDEIRDTKDDKIYEAPTEADQQFGFLIGGFADEMKVARETGAGWVRPHPGPFVWRDMQKEN